MPTYEYECKDCGHIFEAFQGFSEPPLKDCPRCGREVRRLIRGGGGVIFKGSGFYVTDKKGGGKPGGTAPAPSSPAPAASGEGASKAPAPAPAPSTPAATAEKKAAG